MKYIFYIFIVATNILMAQDDDILFVQNKNDKWGFVNGSGNVKIKFIYDFADEFRDGLAIVAKGGKQYETDILTGNIIGRIGAKYGIINRKGKVIVPLQYAEIWPFKENLAVCRKGEFWGFINKNGKVIIPIKYERAFSFSEGLANVKKEKWGFIDSTDKLIIPFTYDLCGPFQEGLANVCVGNILNGKWGYINTKGEIIIPLEYSSASPFKEGLAKVKIGTDEFIIDKNGNIK